MAAASEGLSGQLDYSEVSPGTSKAHGISSDSAADFQNFLSVPACEVGEPRNVRLYEILPLLDLIKVLASADRRAPMPDVAGLTVPVFLDSFNSRLGDLSFHSDSTPGSKYAINLLAGIPG